MLFVGKVQIRVELGELEEAGMTSNFLYLDLVKLIGELDRSAQTVLKSRGMRAFKFEFVWRGNDPRLKMDHTSA